MREYQYCIKYIKGTPNNERTWLGNCREELRNLQREEERWKIHIDYIEGGKVPNKIYKHATLDQFTLWEGILHCSVTTKDGSTHFCPSH